MVLTGRSPRDIFEAAPERGLEIDAMPDAPQLPVGLPSDLLERRPDLVAPEAMLKAADFRIGAARAAWFPSISLTGQLGTQSTELEQLFNQTSKLWGFAGNISLPILTFGRISSNVKASEAARRQPPMCLLCRRRSGTCATRWPFRIAPRMWSMLWNPP